jgi:hypothetical protein
MLAGHVLARDLGGTMLSGPPADFGKFIAAKETLGR